MRHCFYTLGIIVALVPIAGTVWQLVGGDPFRPQHITYLGVSIACIVVFVHLILDRRNKA